jgi:hypothetical protein
MARTRTISVGHEEVPSEGEVLAALWFDCLPSFSFGLLWSVYLDVSGTCVRFWAVLFWFLLAAYVVFNKRLPVLFISYNSMQSSVASSFSNSHLSWINLMIVVVCQCMGITSCDDSSQLSDLRRITFVQRDQNMHKLHC